MNLISSAQCRAARALLNWSQPDLATRCDIHVQTISNFEKEASTPSKTTLSKIMTVFHLQGILFEEDDGVKRTNQTIQQYQGAEGFRLFMDDIYETMKERKGEMRLLNGDPDLWLKYLGEDWYYNTHVPRMREVLDGSIPKILVQEGQYNFIGRQFAEYRWLPKKIWHPNSFYSYGDRIGFLNFDNNDIQIHVIRHRKFAETFRFLFNLVWDQYSIIPDTDDYKPKATGK